jgi:hypothetical protein
MLTTVLILALGMTRQDWYRFEPEAKNFRVELPDKPNDASSRTIKNAAGRSELTTAQLKTSDAVYSIQVTVNVRDVDPKTFDDGIRQFAAAKGAMLGTVHEIRVDGNPGREFEVTEQLAEGQKRSKMRWVVSGNSLFMLSVSAKPGSNLPTNADRFLGSLEIGGANLADRPLVQPEEVKDREITVKEADTGEEKSKAAPKSPAKAPSRKSAAAPKITVSSIPRNAKSYPAEDLQDLSRSFEKERDGFRDVGPAGSVLVGVQVTYIERFGGPKVRSAQPIFRSGSGQNHYLGKIHGEVVPPVTAFVAKPGYAVGGLITHTGLTVDGFCLVFMKVDGDRLDPGDTYNSPWIGDEKGGGPGQVSSKGEVVVGLQGRSGNEVFALGLTALK